MYLCGKETNEYLMIFSATFENVDRVCRSIDEFLQEHGIGHSFVVELGAREIINNAIVHGSQKNPEKKVRFRIYLEKNRLYLKSVDEGKGYKSSTVPPQGEGLRESGFGLSILHQYFESVSFNDSGNEITLELQIVKES